MNPEVVPDVPSKYLHQAPEDTYGGPLDKRVKLPWGLDWDLIRSNYETNCSPKERKAQSDSLQSPTGKYKAKSGKYVKEDEEVENMLKKDYSREPIDSIKVAKIRRYTDAGVSQKNIAKDLGINVKTVVRYQEKYAAEKEAKRNGTSD